MKLDFKKLGMLGAVLLGAMSLNACLDNDDDAAPIQNVGFVAFYNLSPDSEALRFFFNENLINQEPTNYANFFGYVPFENGNYDFSVKAGNNSLDTISLNVTKDRRYSIFAVNEFENLELVSYEDAISIPSTGKVSVRFIQLSPDAPPLKVAVEGIENPIGNFAFKQASAFTELNELLNKDIYLIDNETQDTLLTKEVSLENGRIYSIFSKGFINTTDEDQEFDLQIVPIN